VVQTGIGQVSTVAIITMLSTAMRQWRPAVYPDTLQMRLIFNVGAWQFVHLLVIR
jgi:hypothetical protein